MSCGTCWDPTYCPTCDRDAAKVDAAAGEAAAAIIEGLRARGGFDDLLASIDAETRAELIGDIKAEIAKAMTRDVFTRRPL